ncbi:Spermidine/putrescine transport system permease protein PotB [Rhodobacteraceae bacterium THAF1]|uniref:ABC transporter permease n=1 Tax=Palleronia sp. THAF1 TaxID=2587842 RepID=UPI000F3D930F|nr:ABC transporter permease [Palleronia sp. THAF1]QFU07928.1 Spermidine/putrescine transport system permease protein PotB [Palleronia sp. THAF1]VDC25762.1 Spermidine/putrescine transport system permease protein PotB [Rhodobacteraceae bacterium THAF1]
MSSATDADAFTGATPDNAIRDADRAEGGPVLAADGRPLKASLSRSLRRSKLRALMLIAPLLIFILVTFIAPIADMLFRSVENDIVSQTLPRTVVSLEEWDGTGEPSEETYRALAADLMVATELKNHTRLGSRLNYETTGMSSLFRKTGRNADEFGEVPMEQFFDLNEAWEDPAVWVSMMADPAWVERQADWAERKAEVEAAQDAAETREEQRALEFTEVEPPFRIASAAQEALPRTARAYLQFGQTIQSVDEDSPTEEEPWAIVYQALYEDLENGATGAGLGQDELLSEAAAAVGDFEVLPAREFFVEEVDDDWADNQVWGTIKAFSSPYTAGYFLSSVDYRLTPQGVEQAPDDQKIYGLLFQRTMFMSLTIMFSCILLGYPIAFLLSNLPLRTSNLLLILVLLPFWTSLLVRTSAWKVLLQQQGVINDILVWIGLVGDGDRLQLINNQAGTIIAMTHILLPFMILPLYSVMKTIPPYYVRAAKSLGATNWTAFWRVYFPQSVPGIGAGCILVFILSIGYYITPEIVGGTTGTFISNRIAYHISSSLNWGLAAALGTILLAVVLLLYYVYDRIVGIDNVSLG